MSDRPKILIMEDEPLMTRLYERELSDLPYDITFSANAEAGLDRLKVGYKPDLIILDIMMGAKSGLVFLRELKQNQRYRSIPVVVISNLSDAQGEIEKKALQLGAEAYFVKVKTGFEQIREIVSVCAEIKTQIKLARQALINNQVIKCPEVFYPILDKLEESAANTAMEQIKVASFLTHYRV